MKKINNLLRILCLAMLVFSICGCTDTTNDSEKITDEIITVAVAQVETVTQSTDLVPTPTQPPTEASTPAPTQPPTEAPTPAPTQPPTEAPTPAPTQPPTEAPTLAPTQPPTEVPTQASVVVSAVENPVGYAYVLNMNTHKFHYTVCSSVDQMKDKNRWDYTGTRDDIINMGYVPCKRCNP